MKKRFVSLLSLFVSRLDSFEKRFCDISSLVLFACFLLIGVSCFFGFSESGLVSVGVDAFLCFLLVGIVSLFPFSLRVLEFLNVLFLLLFLMYFAFYHFLHYLVFGYA